MRFTKFFLLAALAATSALGACDSTGGVTSPTEPAVSAPTSKLDPVTGEPVALNMPSADRVYTFYTNPIGASAAFSATDVCQLDDPTCIESCDPVYDFGCQPCPTNNPDAWCYQPPCTTTSIIDTYSTVYTGDEPFSGTEANGVGSTSCGGYLVLIGVGMRMDGSYNITTLHLKFQRIYADGTFGPTELRRYGSAPTQTLEGYAEALPGEVIVGLGVGSQYTDNVRTIRIWKRQIGWNGSAVRTSGSISAESFGYAPGGVLDTSDVIPLADTNKVYVGVGARANDHEVKTLHHHVGTLK